MNTPSQRKRTMQVDARIVKLYSRSNHINHINDVSIDTPQHIRYLAFSYFDGIQIDKVETDGTNVLQEAYRGISKSYSVEDTASSEPYQTILAFTDITSKRENWGYTESEISGFWKEENSSIFFMTLLNLKGLESIDAVLGSIQNAFKHGRHLVYFSFDHSDLIIFAKADSFDEYAQEIFTLDYGSLNLIEDSFTVFGFPNDFKSKSDAFTFEALLSVGVRDFEGINRFFDQYKTNGVDIHDFWLLGRNDIALFNPHATLGWLRDIYLGAKQQENAVLFTTHDLVVLIPIKDEFRVRLLNRIKEKFEARQEEDNLGGKYAQREVFVENCRNWLEDYYNQFKSSYQFVCKKNNVKLDSVWLHWLWETKNLTLSLLSSSLSFDLGMCLFPQFIDFFDYMNRQLGQGSINLKTMEKVRTCFSAFFTNISTLLDSTNHSDRQFLQVPAFHSVSFEMPPKIMAYYIAIGHEMIKALHLKNTKYGFTISPKFAKELDVTSLALQDSQDSLSMDQFAVLRDSQNSVSMDQFISIGIGEGSFYSIQHTTKVFAHELSHYLGGENRCRKDRQEFITKFALQELLSSIIELFPSVLFVQYPIPDSDKPILHPSYKSISDSVTALYDILIESNLTYLPNEKNTGKYLRPLLGQIVKEVLRNPLLLQKYNSQIWSIVHSAGNNCADPGKNTTLPYLKTVVLNEMASVNEPNLGESGVEFLDDMLEKLMQRKAWEIVCTAVEILYGASNFYPISGGESLEAKQFLGKMDKMIIIFSETFADLQLILLLELTVKDYYDLLSRESDGTIPSRVLSIARVLTTTGFWEKQTVINAEITPAWTHLYELLEPSPSPRQYVKNRINPGLINYLERYLICCKKEIDRMLLEPERKDSVERLRQTYLSLSDQHTAKELIKTVCGFVSDYSERIVNDRG